MEIIQGRDNTGYSPGVDIFLTGDEVAIAIQAYLISHGVFINGPQTTKVNGSLCRAGHIYVDPSGFVIYNGTRYPVINEIAP